MPPNNIKAPGHQEEDKEKGNQIVQNDDNDISTKVELEELLKTSTQRSPSTDNNSYTDPDETDNFSTSSFILERLTKESEKVLDDIKINIKHIKIFIEKGKNF